ncbi:conserved hypothetical protein [Lebetimonas natsushimae]|uniref:Protein CR006 P-loop domain-containing protein n=1 Tax=Lebetimonas natsushimae TaxID=1936991 RepID=A0A292Y9R3_9BACT|nr:AAA family ATPase [Lebetimonas natsushimae]GAX87642.1 conserved hypothetical protein [Lebetimonas natsushimae]
MIKEIIIKNIATYDSKGIVIDNLSKVNFIYGANGTGKTTISNYLADNSICNKCQIKWVSEPLEVLVYNKKFKDKNFYSEKLKGIYTFGEKNKDIIQNIEELKNKLENIKQKGAGIKSKKEELEKNVKELEKDLSEYIWKNLYKKYEIDLKQIYYGNISSKPVFKNFILQLVDKFNDENNIILNLDEIKKEYKLLFAENLSKLEKIDINLQQLLKEIITIESNSIFNKKIIGKEDLEISKLINSLNMADWVYKGKEYLNYTNDKCPFCQKPTIDENFKKQIEEYFDEEYENDLETLINLENKYSLMVKNIKIQINNIINKIKQNKVYMSYVNIKDLESIFKILQEKFTINMQKIKEKIKEPSRSIYLKNNSEILNKFIHLIGDLNKKIEEYNEKVEKREQLKEQLKEQFFTYLIFLYKDEINLRLRKIKGMKKGIKNLDKQLNSLRNKYQEINKKIKFLNATLTNISSSVEKINNLLEKFGFNNFKLEIVDNNYYIIVRENGEIAKDTLSEGETTFITFLYFLQLVEGSFEKENVKNSKVLVIDDPISSLDSQVLFIVSTLIKEYILKIRKEHNYFIKQIIILTHNVYFHKEISFISQREQSSNRKDTSYYILRKYNNISFINYFKENPIQSSYELLWKDLTNAITNGNSCKTTIQNIMRKILENYFKIFGGVSEDEIINMFQNPEEKYICKSLISWINEGSHTIPDDFEIQSPDYEIEKYNKVFKEIFFKMGHEAHYKMMMKI